ncbi:MAG: hypothetical protein E7171_02565 [Firmicutes bacterium]|nr:hypothetical protein [Bacillota bacterium]
MINYYSLSKLVKEGIDIEPIINEILLVTISAKTTYPEYTKWFIEKHIPGIYLGTRDTIIAVHNNKIVGVSNIKRDKENKLCTVYFDPKYRKQRLGITLVDKSIELIGDSKPLITMPSSYLPQFKNIIKRYDWQLTDCIDGCYEENTSELVFNGEISNGNKELTNEDRIILTYKHTKDKNILKLLPFGYIKYLLFSIKPNKIGQKQLKNS